MENVNTKKIVGETFEDMSVTEMTMVQGSGDVEPETLLSISAALSTAAATWAFSQGVVQTVKGKC